MADTLGGLIDKLFTIDTKMWINQELMYTIRKMSFDEFENEYFKKSDGAERLWQYLKKCCDLNVQRNQLIDEIDEKVIEIVTDGINGIDMDCGSHIQRKHKTY